jgi:hypothetical protein
MSVQPGVTTDADADSGAGDDEPDHDRRASTVPTDRQLRALQPESHLLVYPDDPEAPLECEVAVYSGADRYIVNLDVGFCTCPDAHFNLDDEEECYHEARARFEAEGLPEWVANSEAVCPMFRALVDEGEI